MTRDTLHATTSKQPRKQRKARFKAHLSRKRKMMASPLSRELRIKHEHYPRRLTVRKGDVVTVTRGGFKGHEGKVIGVHLKTLNVTIDGVTYQKADGKSVPKPIDPSNLEIIKLDLSDRRRKKKFERILQLSGMTEAEIEAEKEELEATESVETESYAEEIAAAEAEESSLEDEDLEAEDAETSDPEEDTEEQPAGDDDTADDSPDDVSVVVTTDVDAIGNDTTDDETSDVETNGIATTDDGTSDDSTIDDQANDVGTNDDGTTVDETSDKDVSDDDAVTGGDEPQSASKGDDEAQDESKEGTQ
jgi:large subunit ribosomal protein L24